MEGEFDKVMDTTHLLNLSIRSEINSEVYRILERFAIPGCVISCVNNENEQIFEYGYASKKQKQRVSSNTIFEIGSLSKAFTALGILLLEYDEKLRTNDLVCEYIPWFYLKLKKEKNYSLKIIDLLTHTSGIPEKTISMISANSKSTAIEELVRGLAGTHIKNLPGEVYHYATVNYDILGYIIEKVSGEPYEEFIKTRIFMPLGLKNTYLFREDAMLTGSLAEGHKFSYFTSREYKAPIYRGNTPAGHIFSNGIDMARWMKLQLGLLDAPEPYPQIIRKSHKVYLLEKDRFNYYNNGWEIDLVKKDFFHSGKSPNYSCFQIINMRKKFGICVLMNTNSDVPPTLSYNVHNIIYGKQKLQYKKDHFQQVDIVYSLVTTIFAGVNLYILKKLSDHFKSNEHFYKNISIGSKVIDSMACLVMVAVLLAGSCLNLRLLFGSVNWHLVKTWGSKAIIYSWILIILFGIVVSLYILYCF